MSITKDTSIKIAIGAVFGILVAIGGFSFTAGREWGDLVKRSDLALKADKGELSMLSSKVSVLADMIGEIDAKRREDLVTLKNIENLAEKTNSRITKIEDNQAWQIQQEVKRLQWQNFKSDPQPTPPQNVNNR